MAEVGIRELKTRASEIVRKVKEGRARYVVTHHGRPVAVIIPVAEVAPAQHDMNSAWDDLVRLGTEISLNWQVEQSTTELLSGMRR